MRLSRRFSICEEGGECSFRLKGVLLPEAPSNSGVGVVLLTGVLSLSNRPWGLLSFSSWLNPFPEEIGGGGEVVPH